MSLGELVMQRSTSTHPDPAQGEGKTSGEKNEKGRYGREDTKTKNRKPGLSIDNILFKPQWVIKSNRVRDSHKTA